MSRKLNRHRGFSVFVLLVALVFASLPAQARPARRAVPEGSKFAVLGEEALTWVRSFFTGLWTKEGVLIDPNGGKAPEGTSIDPNGGLNGEGMSIDPNGRS